MLRPLFVDSFLKLKIDGLLMRASSNREQLMMARVIINIKEQKIYEVTTAMRILERLGIQNSSSFIIVYQGLMGHKIKPNFLFIFFCL